MPWLGHTSREPPLEGIKAELRSLFGGLSKEEIPPVELAKLAHELIKEMKNALTSDQQLGFMQELGKKMGMASARIEKRGRSET